MRLLLSWVRDFVDVTASAEDIAEKLALRGFEVASIDHLADDDAVIDFEVTANRPDCLSVQGFAREIGDGLRPLGPHAVGGAGLQDPAGRGRFRRIRSSQGHDRRRGRLSAVRGGNRRHLARQLARVDDDASAGRRGQADQPDRGCHQLCADGARPSAPCLRSRSARGPRIAHPPRAVRRNDHDAGQREADSRSGHAGDRRRAVRAGGRRRHGRRALGGVGRHVGDCVRKRVLQAGVGSPDEQEARVENRGIRAFRARRRHQRPGRRAAAGDCADADDRRRPRDRLDRGPVSAFPRDEAAASAPGAPGPAARPARARCRSDAHPASAGPGRDPGRGRLGRGGADLPRRFAARGRSHRRSRPPLRLRQARGGLPADDRRGSTARSLVSRPTNSSGGS